MSKKITGLLGWLISLSVPVVLTAAVIRLLLSPLFINIEYRLPHFPEDRYGFSTEERLYYGDLTRRYLVSGEDIDVLRQLTFESGDPLFLERELRHLVDVKVVLRGLFAAAWTASGILILTGAAAFYQREYLPGYLMSAARGGWLTAGLIAAVLTLSLISFNTFFTGFHQIFFEGDSWLFRFSDTLIRLFPLQFWQDVFLVFGMLTAGLGALLGWLLPKSVRP
jgi:integral membrane protein (TIGR01906 family)